MLRSLDAINLATAMLVRDEIDALVTYDQRLADVAEAEGIPIVAPA
jgi:predicted nucleic acid-binding protein